MRRALTDTSSDKLEIKKKEQYIINRVFFYYYYIYLFKLILFST